MRVLVLIPARGGSKGLPGKNLLSVGGISLVGRAVRVGRRFLADSGFDGTVLVDTDCPEIRSEAQRWGAFVPFLRPEALARDTTPTIDNVLHAVDRIEQLRGAHDIVVLLQPTSPLRAVEDVVACFRACTSETNSAVSIVRESHPPEQTLWFKEDGAVTWAFPDVASTARRQELPTAWRLSGAVYVMSTSDLRQHRAFIVPGRTRGVPISVDRAVDVDDRFDLTIAQALTEQFSLPEISIGPYPIGDSHPTFIIAEAGVNHNGDAELAHRLIDVAADAGATAVKFQTFDPVRLVSPKAAMAAYQVENTGRERTQAEMLADLVLSPAVHHELLAHATDRRIMFLSSPFDEQSADFLDELGVPAFKIASGEITNHPLLAHIARKGRPMIVSTGMANLREIDSALDVIARSGPVDVVLLQCTTSYPAKIEDANLLAMSTLRGAFGLPVGYSDHTEGLVAPLAAVAMGARMVEKHFTLDRNMPGPDHKASLTPDELRDLVSGIRAVETARGDGVKEPRPVELPLIVAARKSLHTARDLPEGHILCATDLVALRPGDGIAPTRLDHVLGRTLARPVSGGDKLAENDLV